MVRRRIKKRLKIRGTWKQKGGKNETTTSKIQVNTYNNIKVTWEGEILGCTWRTWRLSHWVTQTFSNIPQLWPRPTPNNKNSWNFLTSEVSLRCFWRGYLNLTALLIPPDLLRRRNWFFTLTLVWCHSGPSLSFGLCSILSRTCFCFSLSLAFYANFYFLSSFVTRTQIAYTYQKCFRVFAALQKASGCSFSRFSTLSFFSWLCLFLLYLFVVFSSVKFSPWTFPNFNSPAAVFLPNL